MGFQSKTYSLSDEVVAAIEDAKAKGESPNKFLRRVLGIDARADADSSIKRHRENMEALGVSAIVGQDLSEPAARDLVVELDGESETVNGTP